MTRRLIKPSLRILAAIAIVVAGLGAQSAPLGSAGGGRCSACGVMRAGAGAKGACCCCTAKGQSPRPSKEQRGEGSSPCSCPECCLPQARNPVVPDDGRMVGRPSSVSFARVDAPEAAPPAGVHVSVFHPPRA
jgi:hypothetical protein